MQLGSRVLILESSTKICGTSPERLSNLLVLVTMSYARRNQVVEIEHKRLRALRP